jgi:hypothetical protein
MTARTKERMGLDSVIEVKGDDITLPPTAALPANGPGAWDDRSAVH